MDCKEMQVENNRVSDFNCNENVTESHSTEDNIDIDAKMQPSDNLATSSFIQESTEFQWCMDDAKKYAEEYDSHPTSIFSFDDTQSSYDDISKNIDVNLAEIDMETFRSEDINSILSLPAVYGESFSSITDNTHNTSESCTSTGKMETATHSFSEGSSDLSIYKNKQLFSPVKEPEIQLGAISTDSLDFSALGKQDINLSCQAQKSNYMIAFEGSTTQLSEDSSGCGVKAYNLETNVRGSMIQSDIGFTTWSKVQKFNKPFTAFQKTSRDNKSSSLPTLSSRGVLPISHKYARPTESMLLYNVRHNTCYVDSHCMNSFGHRSLSLMRLYMLHNQIPNIFTNEKDPDSNVQGTGQLRTEKEVSPNSNRPNQSCHTELESVNSTKNSFDPNSNEKMNNGLKPAKAQLRNIETNNNNVTDYPFNNNFQADTGTHENDNSLYFEDSLMEAAPTKAKFAYASPIKEEEPFEFSSGDEVVEDKKDVYVMEKIESLNEKRKIKNCNQNSHIPQSKLVTVAVSTSENYSNAKNLQPSPLQNTLIVKESSTQATQTKSVNQIVLRNSSPNFFSKRVASDGDSKSGCDKSLTNASMICSLSKCESSSPLKTTKVTITKTRNNSTQIPVHIKDKAIQTSFMEGITWKTLEQDKDVPETVPGVTVKQVKVPPGHRPMYIYYPNYSLPDLSFLNAAPNISESSFSLAPERATYSSAKGNFKRRAKSSEGRSRPKSFNVEKPCHHTIEDWASLSVLLPDGIKGMIQKDTQMLSKTNFIPPPPLPRRLSHAHRTSSSAPKFFPLPHMRKSDTYDNCGAESKKAPKNEPKRWSLQEPLFRFEPVNSSVGQHAPSELPGRSVCPFGDLEGQKNYPTVQSKLSHPRIGCSSGFSDKYLSGSSQNSSKSSYREAKRSDPAVILNVPNEADGNAEANDEEACHSPDYSKPPMEFFVSPTQPSCEFEEHSKGTVEEEIWEQLVHSKSYLFKMLEERTKALCISFRSKPEELQVKEMDTLIAFFRIVYQMLADGISSPVQLPGFPVYTSDYVFQFIQAALSYDHSPIPLSLLMREVQSVVDNSSLLKFYNFVLLLLNTGWFDYWFQYTVSSVDAVRKYYTATSFMYLLTFPIATQLHSELIDVVIPLKDVDFRLKFTDVLDFMNEQEAKPTLPEVSNKYSGNSCMKRNVEKTPPKDSALNNAGLLICAPEENRKKDSFSKLPTYRSHDNASVSHFAKEVIPEPVKDHCNCKPSAMENIDSGCISTMFNNANKEEMPKFQQLRQQWEKLACTEDSVPVAKQSSGFKPDVKAPAKASNANNNKRGAKAPKKDSGIAGRVECVEKEHDVIITRKRSMIPIHKSSKTLGNIRRGCSAPSERGAR